MKVYNIDYRAAEGQPVVIGKVIGFNSEEEATTAELAPDMVRLQARSAADLAALGEPVLLALRDFKAKKGQELEATPEAIWDVFQPNVKKKSKQPLQSEVADGISAPSESVVTNPATGSKPRKRVRKMAKVTTKKNGAAKKHTKKNGTVSPRGEKTLMVKGLLERKSGTTLKEVLDRTGWPAVSMPAMAKAAGLKLRKEKEKGIPTRYYGS